MNKEDHTCWNTATDIVVRMVHRVSVFVWSVVRVLYDLYRICRAQAEM